MGERDGGFVVSSLAFAFQGPSPEVIQGSTGPLCSMSCEQRGASPMHDQGSKVDITALTDASESAVLSTGVFTGGEPEPGSEVSAGREALDIAYRRPDGGAGE